VFRCVLGSESRVLVPRSSGTPVATWARPTWVVSRRRVLEAVFILLEFPSPSRRIFIGSHSLPPLWFAVSVLQSIRVRFCLFSLLRCCRQDCNLIVRVHLRPGEQVSGTVVFVILHREKANKVFGKRSSHDCSQTTTSSMFWRLTTTSSTS
jgi:hypothetical protein